jgi:hypothetical protein
MTLAQSENTGSCIGAHIVYGRCGERDARSTKEVAEEVSGHKTQSIFESLPDVDTTDVRSCLWFYTKSITDGSIFPSASPFMMTNGCISGSVKR